MARKVLVIGLDGATFDIIDPLLNQGELPVIGTLIRNGVRGRLLSTIPYATMPAWPSFMTGKNPGKHGVFDFFNFVDGRQRISNSQDLRSHTLWEILSAYGKQSIVMNVPGTFPPTEINGVMVSGMLTPVQASFASPSEIEGFLDQVANGYRINSRSNLHGPELVKDEYEVTEKQKACFLALLESRDWDLAMMMFRITDVLQHHFWEEQEIIRDCYRYIDSVIGEIVEACSGTTVFLISDHGFQSQVKDFHINKWLIDQGYMSIKRGKETNTSRWQEIGQLEGREALADDHMSRLNPSQMLVHLGLTRQRLRSLIPHSWRKILKSWVPRIWDRIPASTDVAYDVDWENTRASAYQLYSMESKAIKVMNASPRLREKLCTELAEKLEGLEDPQTDEPFVRRAYRREELYTGPYLTQGPDIILDLQQGYNITNAFFADSYVSQRKSARGFHHREGILVAQGDDIESGKELDFPPSLLDVMPTILHYLGLSIPNDCDGVVLQEIFDTDSESSQRGILYADMKSKDRITNDSRPYLDNEQAEVEERLRALGYL